MRAVVYARTSTADQASNDKVSIPDQLKWAKEFCREKGWDYVGEYIEPGIRGYTELEDRPAMSLLLKELNKFDIVLIYHSSRIAREADLVLKFHRLLANDKVQVYCRNTPVDPVNCDDYYWGGNYAAQIVTAIAGIGDQQENVARGERVRSGFKGMAQRGVLVFAPYGYRKIYKIDSRGKRVWEFEIDPVKASLVEKIFYSYGNNGLSIRGIMYDLNESKIPAPTGGYWTTATIKNILNNPAYKGYVRWGRKLGSRYKQGKSSSGKQKRVILPADKCLLAKGSHPVIIDEILFDKVQARLMERGKLAGRAIASPGLLSGLVKCGICGCNAYHKTRRIKIKTKNGLKPGVRSDYICSTYIRMGKNFCKRHLISSKKINQIVLEDIKSVFNDTVKRKKLFYVGKESQKSLLDQKTKQYESELKKLDNESRRLLKAYTSGYLKLNAFGEEKERIDQEAAIINSKLEELNKLSTQTNSIEEAQKRFISLAKQIKEGFEKKSFSVQKDLLLKILDSVVIDKEGNIKINYKLY